MARFKLEIACDNAAFSHDEGGVNLELDRILSTLATRLVNSRDLQLGDEGPLHDVNGNRVGEWSFDDV